MAETTSGNWKAVIQIGGLIVLTVVACWAILPWVVFAVIRSGAEAQRFFCGGGTC